MPVNEEKLLRDARAGDHEAFETLMRERHPAIWKVALRMTGNFEDSEDVEQETLLRAWSGLTKFRSPPSKLETWLQSIARRCGVDLLRAREPQEFPRLVRRDVESPDPDPYRRAFSSEMWEYVLEEIGKLSAAERMVFEMRYFEGLSAAAIAEVLGVTEGTVRQTLFRAISRLRPGLEALVRKNHASDRRRAD